MSLPRRLCIPSREGRRMGCGVWLEETFTQAKCSRFHLQLDSLVARRSEHIADLSFKLLRFYSLVFSAHVFNLIISVYTSIIAVIKQTSTLQSMENKLPSAATSATQSSRRKRPT